MSLSKLANSVFTEAINTYHVINDVQQPLENPFQKDSIEHILYHKNWIDTVQWHFEDLIRDPAIEPTKALVLKRKIDASNQDRTDKVEQLDDYFLDLYKNVSIQETATLNTESPAWAIDRLSILALKIYHMEEETNRADATESHRQKCQTKLSILLEQRTDLSLAIDQLLDDMEIGKKFMKVYRQMKMYNDESLNPVLYAKK